MYIASVLYTELYHDDFSITLTTCLSLDALENTHRCALLLLRHGAFLLLNGHEESSLFFSCDAACGQDWAGCVDEALLNIKIRTIPPFLVDQLLALQLADTLLLPRYAMLEVGDRLKLPVGQAIAPRIIGDPGDGRAHAGNL